MFRFPNLFKTYARWVFETGKKSHVLFRTVLLLRPPTAGRNRRYFAVERSFLFLRESRYCGEVGQFFQTVAELCVG